MTSHGMFNSLKKKDEGVAMADANKEEKPTLKEKFHRSSSSSSLVSFLGNQVKVKV